MLLLLFYYDVHMWHVRRDTDLKRDWSSGVRLFLHFSASLSARKVGNELSSIQRSLSQDRRGHSPTCIYLFIYFWKRGWSMGGCLSPSLHDTLPLHCCPQHLHGAVTNCPRKSLCGPQDPPFIFPDSNLVLALLHTCHCVFFLTLEAGGKRTVINGATSSRHGSFIIV